MNDARARVFLEEGFCQQADNVIALDKLPFFIEQEAAVEIAVKGNAHVCAMLNHGVAGIGAALRQQRIGNAIRERAVRGVMDFNEGHRHVKRFKAGFKGIDYRTSRTVAGVDNQLQRLKVREVDVAQQVVDIGVTQIDFFYSCRVWLRSPAGNRWLPPDAGRRAGRYRH
ncbi:Uncharacterised protein [Leclercia adecarboxylata]|uniref:Uncharacterized protein n=1 Tax=Leclercia adecarboxylata TaxID=83655 RepID=A0A4U9I4L6_9ENTR|nr:Uncharacterised protein [Leclercia adecarboxylata]